MINTTRIITIQLIKFWMKSPGKKFEGPIDTVCVALRMALYIREYFNIQSRNEK